MVRDSKQSFYDKIADKLKCETLSSKDWWSTLKTAIASNSKSTIPPLTYNDNIYSDERDKANILNDYFQSQTLLDDQNAVLPELPLSVTYTQLSQIVLTPLEVESVLKTLTIGKASGPNELSNCILRELSCELSSPFCSLFNHALRMGIVPSSYKEANVSPVPKKGDLTLETNYRPKSLLNSEAKVFERLIFGLNFI